ncbi:hypothetical protein BFW38_09925 [Terasakiispira papahanaumokuakeensis]|uniref:Uncharacterized protein n=1 Tax=Terasakiispira papahanaumokuakeensis TaxID=197479 RepID=A0A1E2VAC4_9GAMM|nr:hypothetical protein BFW38_09925 [Terasakiispira papahanaumokuakeensis]
MPSDASMNTSKWRDVATHVNVNLLVASLEPQNKKLRDHPGQLEIQALVDLLKHSPSEKHQPTQPIRKKSVQSAAGC